MTLAEATFGPSGYGSRVRTPVAVKVARLSRRSLCAALALAVSVTCMVLAVAALTMPTSGLVNASPGGPGVPAVAASVIHVAGQFDADMVGETFSPLASVMSSSMGSMCGSECVTEVLQVCAVVAILTVTTLLALLLASRRHTFMGMLSATGPYSRHRRLPRQAPRTARSPISLCCLRV